MSTEKLLRRNPGSHRQRLTGGNRKGGARAGKGHAGLIVGAVSAQVLSEIAGTIDSSRQICIELMRETIRTKPGSPAAGR